MESERKKKLGGIIVGPILVVVAVGVLWKNEGRFDFYRAAKETTHIQAPSEVASGDLFSYTESMDRELTMAGEYVVSFVGYLEVRRSAEIYAWDRDEDSDGHVSWRKEWMSSVQSNSRNSGLRQQLSYNCFLPKTYEVGELTIDSNRIEFVDSRETISPVTLQLADAGRQRNLAPGGQYFYLRKRQSGDLGDERISYAGIPVPAVATYFGKFAEGRGVAHRAVERGGLIDNLIHDSGVLHHLVAGQRADALKSLKAYLARLKWIVRGCGVAATVLGFAMFFGSIIGFLYHVPIIGPIANFGALAVSALCGILLGISVIVVSHLFHHPLTLAALVLAIGGAIYFVRKRGRASRDGVRQNLEQRLGHELTATEIEELEFVELVQLAMSDDNLDLDERKYLFKWAKRHQWDEAKTEQMLGRAKRVRESEGQQNTTQQHLKNLIELALADSNISTYEMRVIRKAANDAGCTDAQIRAMVNELH